MQSSQNFRRARLVEPNFHLISETLSQKLENTPTVFYREGMFPALCKFSPLPSHCTLPTRFQFFRIKYFSFKECLKNWKGIPVESQNTQSQSFGKTYTENGCIVFDENGCIVFSFYIDRRKQLRRKQRKRKNQKHRITKRNQMA